MLGKYYLGIDIGGTRIKAILLKSYQNENSQELALRARKVKPVSVLSHLSKTSTVGQFIDALRELLSKVGATKENVLGVGVSSAGGVNVHGTAVICSAPHLAALTSPDWLHFLEQTLEAPVILVNDAEAAALGAAAFGTFEDGRSYLVAPIGTGLGASVIKNGRKWGGASLFQLPLLGSIYTPEGSYDELVSTKLLSRKSPISSLDDVIQNPKFAEVREQYLDRLAGIFVTAANLYGLDEICLAGGCVNAAIEDGWDLAGELQKKFSKYPSYSPNELKATLLKDGNQLPLIGTTLLARGHSVAERARRLLPYQALETEKPFDPEISLQNLDTQTILEKLSDLEEKAGEKTSNALPSLKNVIEKALPRLQSGGRLIYVGCGTSGRLAAIDAVELGCTFGCPREKVISLIPGGIQKAALEVESNHEEDDSSVPEMLLLNVKEQDVVIGISVSGSSFYVQSALAYAKAQKAQSVLVQERDEKDLPFCDEVIPLDSGLELVAGSTRMKAGTATKRILNFLSTTLMIRMGRVYGCYMVNLQCNNEKLVERAIHILTHFFPISADRAKQLLKESDYRLDKTIAFLNTQKE